MTTAVASSGPDDSGPEDGSLHTTANTITRLLLGVDAASAMDLSKGLPTLPTQPLWRLAPGRAETYVSDLLGIVGKLPPSFVAADEGRDSRPDVMVSDSSGKHSASWVVQVKSDGSVARGKAPRRLSDFGRDVQAYRMVPASKATLIANEVRNQQEMGDALRMLREEVGLSIGQLAKKVKPLNIAGVGRSTVGRVMAGGTLCQTEEALVALVKACGVADADVPVWVAARERARAGQKRRGRRPAAAATLEVVEPEPDVSGEGPPTAAMVQVKPGGGDHDLIEEEYDEAGDDEVIGTIQITRGHLRAAVVLSAVAGVAAMSSQAPSARNAGAVVLGVAGVLALLDTLRASTTPGPAAVSAAA